MKKYVLLLGLVLVIPFIVLADAAGPAILGYDAVVTNPNGAKIEGGEEEVVIPYNTTIHIWDEDREEASIDNYCVSSDKCYSGRVKKSDIMPVKTEIIPSANDKSFDAVNTGIIILEKNGAKLYKGPAPIYGTYDKVIPYKTRLKAKYAISSYEGESSFYTWLYIDDSGYKGWVSINYLGNYKIGSLPDEIMTYFDAKMVDDNGKALLTIPKETIIKNAYYMNDSLFVSYSNIDGFIQYEGIGTKSNSIILLEKNTNITDGTDKNRLTVPAGEVVTELFSQGCNDKGDKCYRYVQYNNVKGFIISESVDIFLSKNELKKTTIETTNNTDVFGYGTGPEGIYRSSEKKIGTIAKGQKLTSYYQLKDNGNNWYLVFYNNKFGFINAKNITTTITEDKPTSSPTIEPTIEPNSGEIENVETPTPVPSNGGEKDPTQKSNNIILYAIIGAVGLSIITALVIVIVNLNKKVNKLEKSVDEEKKDEVKKETQD